ncbi:hypothetical protein [Bradyrhizobium sp. AS23.2]|nr:hypothetical protein [Bradyrhizobium sp. AS23.2]
MTDEPSLPHWTALAPQRHGVTSALHINQRIISTAAPSSAPQRYHERT